MKATFIGLGGQKCASTWMYKILQEHPEVALSKYKELNYFSDQYILGQDWYERFFEGINKSVKAVGEISPSYLPHPLAPKRAYLYNPDFRIVIALRDPVERAFSNHLHMVRLGYVNGPDYSFEKGLKSNLMYIEQSRYATHLQNWLEFFPRESVHVAFQEEIASHGTEVANNIYRLLGLSLNYQSSNAQSRFNESRIYDDKGIYGAIKSGAIFMRSIGLDSFVQATKKVEFIESWRRSSGRDLRQIVPPMLDETRERLTDELMPEMETLRNLLGRDSLPWSSWRSAVSYLS